LPQYSWQFIELYFSSWSKWILKIRLNKLPL
jgi:hypothetical protein